MSVSIVELREKFRESWETSIQNNYVLRKAEKAMMSSIHRFTKCTNAGVHACHIAQLYNTQSQGARWNEFRRTLVTNPVKPKRIRRENVFYCAMEIKKKTKTNQQHLSRA